jgi:hypothetical protein
MLHPILVSGSIKLWQYNKIKRENLITFCNNQDISQVTENIISNSPLHKDDDDDSMMVKV